jgi:hypothetical protein
MENEHDRQQASTRQRPGGWLGIALVVSLGLNILLVGVVGGAYLRDWQRQAARPDRPDRAVQMLGLRPYWRAMDPESRAQLAKAVREMRGALRERRGVYRGFGRDLRAALLAEPFDREALQAVFTRQADMLARRMSLGRKVLVDRIAEMTPEQRRALAKRLFHTRHRPGQPGWKTPRPGEGLKRQN